VNGRIDQPGDVDVFSFEGRAGTEIVAEVMARRLNSPLDSVLRLTDTTGKQIAFNDDFEDKGAGLETHHAIPIFASHSPRTALFTFTLATHSTRVAPSSATGCASARHGQISPCAWRRRASASALARAFH